MSKLKLIKRGGRKTPPTPMEDKFKIVINAEYNVS